MLSLKYLKHFKSNIRFRRMFENFHLSIETSLRLTTILNEFQSVMFDQ